MDGYSRIKKPNTTRSKSLDLADLSAADFNSSNSKFKFHEAEPKLTTTKNTVMHNSIPEHEDENGEVFGIILSQKCSNPSAPPQKVMAEQKSSSFMSKSLHLKRSTSVSESYSRMHHQSNFTADDDNDDDQEFTSEKKYVKKKGKFLKACNRLFGF
ncbi:hypothetical protein BUALT_Bualt08G0135800 [Buddleja alternifolia]|uniref:Uncharacterized protein n=1 Tax=Buddleja alternifolia TaxID=168488 RepID=A0AAV6X7C4_9LAMI|nr:hypothetical protein BUALT_Bualt08G0135800 [Buddleja alternifolia]